MGGAFFWSMIATADEKSIRSTFVDSAPTQNGKYRFVLPLGTGTVEVEIDEWIPCLGEREVDGRAMPAPAYGMMGRNNEMWSLLYAKACVKAHVSGCWKTTFEIPPFMDSTKATALSTLGLSDAAVQDDTIGNIVGPSVMVASQIAAKSGGDPAALAGFVGDMSAFASDVGVSEESTPVATSNLPQYVITMDGVASLETCVIVTNAPQDITATVTNSHNLAVATLGIANMTQATLRSLTLRAADAPYVVTLSTSQQNVGVGAVRVGFSFDKEGAQIEAREAPAQLSGSTPGSQAASGKPWYLLMVDE
jgi:hypothetical protein